MKKKVSIFATCLTDMFYPQVTESMYRLLKRQGFEVDFPQEQICCGQPSFNSGYFDEAAKVAKGLLTAFRHSDYVVTPSGSCCAMVRDNYHTLFKDDSKLLKEAEDLAGKLYEFSEFFVRELGVTDLGAKYKGKVTYHHSCHMSRLLGIKKEPIELITNIKGIEYIELPNNQDCCGFGGTFSVKMADISAAMVADKVENVKKTGAEILVGSDMSCLMNISGALSRQGHSIEAMHVAELLDRGLKNG